MSDQGNSNGVDLSALSFGPAWARDEKPKKDYKDYTPREASRSGNNRGRFAKGRAERNERPDRNDRRNAGRSEGRGRGGRERRTQDVPVPEGFTGEVMPIEEGLDNLCKQILQTARTHSVFDLARLVLESRERFNVSFTAPQGTKIFRNIVTSAAYLTKEEALLDFIQSDLVKELYTEVTREVDPPSGNFPSVARCQKSGVYLGPVNRHDYQAKLQALHRERFSQLSYRGFLNSIETLTDEESIQAWIESEKVKTYYLPKEHATEEEPADELLLKSSAELEAHFAQGAFNKYYKQVQTAFVPSNIPRRLLSPALFTLLKNTISEEKRYPGKLASLMCRQLSGRNVAVFKVNKKLNAGPSRPHALPELSTLSERPQAIVNWAIKNDGKGIDQLWQELLPADISEDDKAQWFHDLKWLLTQGFVTLMKDGEVFYSRKKEQSEPTPSKKKSSPKATEPKPTPTEAAPAEPEAAAPVEKVAEEATAAPTAAEPAAH